MTAHAHTEHVEGCFRCDLSREDAFVSEVHETLNLLSRRLAEEAPAVKFLRLEGGYVLQKEGP